MHTFFSSLPFLLNREWFLIVIQLALLTDCQAHRSSVITSILRTPPLALNAAEVGAMANTHVDVIVIKLVLLTALKTIKPLNVPFA